MIETSLRAQRNKDTIRYLLCTLTIIDGFSGWKWRSHFHHLN